MSTKSTTVSNWRFGAALLLLVVAFGVLGLAYELNAGSSASVLPTVPANSARVTIATEQAVSHHARSNESEVVTMDNWQQTLRTSRARP